MWLKTLRLGCIILCTVTLALSAQKNPTPSELFLKTVPAQISASTLTELVEWCKDLGLSTLGSRRELEERLFAYYGIPPPDPVLEDVEETRVVIQAAESSEYFSLEEFDEEYVRLSGGVHLIMEDRERGAVYTLWADSVLYNRTKRLLSATGNIRYEIKYQGRVEKFTGRSLLLNLENWEGYFFYGESLRERTVGGEPLTFRLLGEFISRSRGDFALIENASITSSPVIPSNYRIDAGKIWLLGPDEWAVESATLYVGHIPIFYFPLFFYPGDEVVFHPVFGYRSREGTFLQTTTYLLGNRKAEVDTASFMQLAEPGLEDRVKIRHGIFLRDTEERLPRPDWYVKALLDIYSRLGMFGGIQGSLPLLLPEISTFTFSAGLGLSRNLYFGTVPGLAWAYTPYWMEPDGTFRTFWNTTDFFGQELPFRFGGELRLEYIQDPLRARFLFESYSDPFFSSDFLLYRREHIDWSRLLQGTILEEPAPVIKEQLDWTLDFSYTPNIPSLAPWITSLRIPRGRISLNWRSKGIPSALLKDYELSDPTRRFYYPSLLTLPELSLELGGTLFHYSSQERFLARREPTPPPRVRPEIPELRPPWVTEEGREEQITEEEEEEALLRPPAPLPDAPLQPLVLPITLGVSYLWRPTFTYQNHAYPEPWIFPWDVQYEAAYATLTADNLFQLRSDVNLWGRIIQNENTLSILHRYRDVSFWDEDLPVNLRRSLEITSYRYRTFSVSNLQTLTSYPLVHTELFPNSSVSYTVNALLFQRSFKEMIGDRPIFLDRYLDFSQNTITQHRTQLNLIANLDPIQPQLQMTYTMPPLDEELSTLASLTWGPSTTSIRLTQEKEEAEWINQPILFQQRLQFSPQVYLNAAYIYDVEQHQPMSLTFSTLLFYLSLRYTASYTEPYDFMGVADGWVRQDEKRFIPSDLDLALSYRYEPDPFWKNRIRLSTGFQMNYSMSLIRYTESFLSFTYDLTFSIYRFLDLKFSATSKNTMVYQYFPALARGVDRTWRNPLVDLLKSFNFFEPQDRFDSFFKLSSIQFEVVRHLDDWRLTVSYTGSPELVTLGTGRQQFRWNAVLGIFLQWKPIPEVRSEFRYDKAGWTF